MLVCVCILTCVFLSLSGCCVHTHTYPACVCVCVHVWVGPASPMAVCVNSLGRLPCDACVLRLCVCVCVCICSVVTCLWMCPHTYTEVFWKLSGKWIFCKKKKNPQNTGLSTCTDFTRAPPCGSGCWVIHALVAESECVPWLQACPWHRSAAMFTTMTPHKQPRGQGPRRSVSESYTWAPAGIQHPLPPATVPPCPPPLPILLSPQHGRLCRAVPLGHLPAIGCPLSLCLPQLQPR